MRFPLFLLCLLTNGPILPIPSNLSGLFDEGVRLAMALKEPALTIGTGGGDTRPQFVVSSFGFEPDGEMHLRVDDFVLLGHDGSTAKKNFNVYFILQKSNQQAPRTEEKHCIDPTNEEGGFEVFRIGDDPEKYFCKPGAEDKNKPDCSDTATFEVNKEFVEPGLYHLYFSNCEVETGVQFKLHLEQYNVANGKKDYLTAGESGMPTWYLLLSIAFVVELVVWLGVLRKNKDNVLNIHHLMTVVVVTKAGCLLFESFNYFNLKNSGEPHGWNILYYIFSFLKGFALFMTIALIGTGWSYLKPFLTDRDKKIIFSVLGLQLIVNIAVVVLDEYSEGYSSYLEWRDIMHLVDMVSCCLILFPIVWSIRHLKEASVADGKAARNMEKLKQFRRFYLLVVTFIYFTRIIVLLLGATLPFESVWIKKVLDEFASLGFYAASGYLFRPQRHNPYFALDTSDLDPDSAQDEELETLTSDPQQRQNDRSIDLP